MFQLGLRTENRPLGSVNAIAQQASGKQAAEPVAQSTLSAVPIQEPAGGFRNAEISRSLIVLKTALRRQKRDRLADHLRSPPSGPAFKPP